MRKSGILMHISSLPSPYGIGSLGQKAYDFADFLHHSGQRLWQLLPLSPTGYGDSPYQSFSSFAGNPYFIDLDILSDWGLLSPADYEFEAWGSDPLRVDYGLLYKKRFPVLYKACDRLLSKGDDTFELFCQQNAFWLEDYALFMALKDANGGQHWDQWPLPLRSRNEKALEEAKSALSSDIARNKALQFLFFKQWNALHDYCRSKGIELIGDIPIYAAPDSADVWASPECFMLDESFKPIEVAGCPPDGFTADGQLWGNPVYNWQKLSSTDYFWWIRRIAHQFEIYDILRIDHFRGFDEYYSIPYGEKTARHGQWRKGPEIELFNALERSLGRRKYIAEDLGFITDGVRRLLSESGFPGMKVLQFAFEGSGDNDYLPHNYEKNCVAYTGTHDNDTILGWYESADTSEREKALSYMRSEGKDDIVRAMLCTLWGCTADTAIAMMQDLLGLGSEGRMNTPGSLRGNWQWRMPPDAPLNSIAEHLFEMSRLYGRI